MKKSILFLLLFASLSAIAQKKQPYVLYNAKGKKISYEKMLKTVADKDILLFGEFHNNAIAHWLQFRSYERPQRKTQSGIGCRNV